MQSHHPSPCQFIKKCVFCKGRAGCLAGLESGLGKIFPSQQESFTFCCYIPTGRAAPAANKLLGGCCSPVCLPQAHHVSGSFCLPLLLHTPAQALSLRCCPSVPAKPVPAKPVPAKSVPAKPSAQPVRGLGKCLLLSPQAAVALWGSMLGSPPDGKHHGFFRWRPVSETQLSACLKLSLIFTP